MTILQSGDVATNLFQQKQAAARVQRVNQLMRQGDQTDASNLNTMRRMLIAGPRSLVNFPKKSKKPRPFEQRLNLIGLHAWHCEIAGFGLSDAEYFDTFLR